MFVFWLKMRFHGFFVSPNCAEMTPNLSKTLPFLSRLCQGYTNPTIKMHGFENAGYSWIGQPGRLSFSGSESDATWERRIYLCGLVLQEGLREWSGGERKYRYTKTHVYKNSTFFPMTFWWSCALMQLSVWSPETSVGGAGRRWCIIAFILWI